MSSLLRDIERFLRDNEMPSSTFGRLAVNDPRLVGDLRNLQRELRSSTVARVRAFMEGYQKP